MSGQHVILAIAGIGLLVCGVGVLHTATLAQGTFERTLTVSGPIEVNVRSLRGDITVRTGSPDRVRVVGHVRAGLSLRGTAPSRRVERVRQAPPIELSGDRLDIGAREAATLMPLTRDVSISYEVVVPAGSRVRASSVAGAQRFEGSLGAVSASANSGSVRIESVTGDLTVSTGSGRVEVGRVGGALHARTGSGSLVARAVAGSVTVRSGGGHIAISKTGPEPATLVTGSGGAALDGVTGALTITSTSGSVDVAGRPTEPWDLRTTSGRVRLSLPEDAAFTLDARSTSGAIRADNRLTPPGASSPRLLRGPVHAGGPSVSITTSSGAITIERN